MPPAAAWHRMLLTPEDAAAAVAAALMLGVAAMAMLLVLRARQPQRRGDPWLLVLALACALSGLGDLSVHLHAAGLRHWLEAPAVAALLLPGPALWLYATRTLGAPTTGWRSALPHLLPFALVALLLWYAGPDPAPADAAQETHRSASELWGLLPIALQMLCYGAALVRRLARWNHHLRQHYSDLSHRSLRWLWLLFGLFAAVLAAWVLTWPLALAWSNVVTNLLMAAALAVIGLHGPRQVALVALRDGMDKVGENEGAALYRTAAPLAPAAPTATAVSSGGNADQSMLADAGAMAAAVAETAPGAAAPPAADGDRASQAAPGGGTTPYQKAALTAPQVGAIQAGLQQAMEGDKLYLESDLTLAQLAQALAVSPHQLSQFLSQHLGLSFYDYVNGLRIEAVKATLARPQSARRSLLDIALECGFGSKSTFNAVFKKSTGVSPTTYRTGLAVASQPP